MKSQATWGIVGVLAVAGILGVSLQPGARLGGENGTGALRVSATQAHAQASETDTAEKKRACDDIAQVLEVFLAINDAPRPQSCFVDDSSQSGNEQFKIRTCAAGGFGHAAPRL